MFTLSEQFQRQVDAQDYEVIVVENASSAELGEKAALQYGANFRYFHRQETQPTPVHAVNFGASQSRGQFVAIMIDGARMVTPG
ncbi:MAG: glycosyltransferase, partial [Pseudomonadales bacterium]